MIVPLVFFTAGLTLASGGVAVAQTAPQRAPGQTSAAIRSTPPVFFSAKRWI